MISTGPAERAGPTRSARASVHVRTRSVPPGRLPGRVELRSNSLQTTIEAPASAISCSSRRQRRSSTASASRVASRPLTAAGPLVPRTRASSSGDDAGPTTRGCRDRQRAVPATRSERAKYAGAWLNQTRSYGLSDHAPRPPRRLPVPPEQARGASGRSPSAKTATSVSVRLPPACTTAQRESGRSAGGGRDVDTLVEDYGEEIHRPLRGQRPQHPAQPLPVTAPGGQGYSSATTRILTRTHLRGDRRRAARGAA